MSDTPRTDALVHDYFPLGMGSKDEFIEALKEHARQLENELASARAGALDTSEAERLLNEALRLPSRPFPDPGAHSAMAWGKAVHSAYCAIRFKVMDAQKAIRQLAARPDAQENDK